MRYTRWAADGPPVSVLGFGCWAAGGLWWGDSVDDDAAIAAMRAAWQAGVTLFDTAPLYGHGHADVLLARALGDDLSRAVVATKCGVRTDGPGQHAESDLSHDHVVADVDASLRRLGLQQLPLVQTHWPCQRGTPLEETLRALCALRRSGKIAAFGLCNEQPEGLARAAELLAAAGEAPMATFQTPYSLLRREYEQTLRGAVAGIAPPPTVLCYEPLCRGLLTGKFTARQRFPESDLRARDDRFQGDRYLRALAWVARLQLIADRMREPVAALALAWLLQQPHADVALCGAKNPAQVGEHLRAMSVLDALDDPASGVSQRWPTLLQLTGSWRG